MLLFHTKVLDNTNRSCVDLCPMFGITGQCTFTHLPKPTARVNGIDEQHHEMLEGVEGFNIAKYSGAMYQGSLLVKN